MKRARLVTLFVALSAAVFSSAALAGEAKNQAPFNRIVAMRQLVGGEQKNMTPFTNQLSRPRPTPDWLERYAAAHPYGRDVVASPSATASPGFHWHEALIGAAVGAAACLLLVGLVAGRTRLRSLSERHPAGA